MHQNASKCTWSSAACFSFRQKFRLQQPLIREPSAEGISGVSTGVKNLSTGRTYPKPHTSLLRQQQLVDIPRCHQQLLPQAQQPKSEVGHQWRLGSLVLEKFMSFQAYENRKPRHHVIFPTGRDIRGPPPACEIFGNSRVRWNASHATSRHVTELLSPCESGTFFMVTW